MDMDIAQAPRAMALVVLAAGAGTRMASDIPKPLHPLGGVPLLAHALAAGAALNPVKTIVITGHGADAVENAVDEWAPNAICVRQTAQLGTGHAVLQATQALAGFDGDVIVLYADTPFISHDTLRAMQHARNAHDVVVLGFTATIPGGYGRLILEGHRLIKIVEAKDATPQERQVTTCNSGLLMADAVTLMRLLAQVTPGNAAGEYYLTDVPALAVEEGLSTAAILCDEKETLGINTRSELAVAEATFQAQRRAQMLADGVALLAPDTVHVAFDTVIERDTVVEPYVVFGLGVRVAGGARIRAFSHLEGADVGAGAIVGPYARLRPGTRIANTAHVGNFVEIKAADIGDAAKVNHLSYIGDAAVGAGANIGAGTVTCNYDGVMKHRTVIGKNAFVGSDTMLVAPVTIGDGAITASGSTITHDVPDDALAIARARQVTKPGRAHKLMAWLRAVKAEKTHKKG